MPDPLPLTPEEWQALYATSSLRELATRFGVSHETIRKRLVAAGVVPRGAGEGLRLAVAQGKWKRTLPEGHHEPVEVACEWCGVTFRKRASQIERCPHHYCCREHATQGETRKSRLEPITLTCGWCGVAFQRHPTRRRQYPHTYCCRAHANWGKERLRKRPPP